jgi:hypothetical protein
MVEKHKIATHSDTTGYDSSGGTVRYNLHSPIEGVAQFHKAGVGHSSVERA